MSPLAFRLLPAVLIAGWLLPMPAPAQSQYPNQPIKLIVPYAPGGVPDTTARLLAQKLQDRVGQSVVVENRAGGNGSIGAGVIAAAPADGYTLLVVDTTLLSVSPLFISQLSYNPQKDFVPIAALARTWRRRSRRCRSSSIMPGRIRARSTTARRESAARII